MAASPAAFGQQVAGSANISLHPVVERGCVREYLDDLLACRRGPEPGLEPEVPVDVDELAPEQPFTRVVLWEARRHPLELLAANLVTGPLDLRDDRHHRALDGFFINRAVGVEILLGVVELEADEEALTLFGPASERSCHRSAKGYRLIETTKIARWLWGWGRRRSRRTASGASSKPA